MAISTAKSKQYIRILGIDPGSNAMGYAVIDARGEHIQLVDIGVLRLPTHNNQSLKLRKIYHEVIRLVDTFAPDELAIEAPFYGKNPQSMLKLGRAQGVAIVAAANKAINVTEYSPKSIKQSVTGNGNASKEQVAGVLRHILKTPFGISSQDATDALGAAVCHHFKGQKSSAAKSYSGWKDFIHKNPGRTRK